MDAERVRDAYSSIVEQYIAAYGTPEQVHPDDLDFIGRHLSVSSGRVLDLGCGPGHITGHLRSIGVDATGIDMVPEFIAHAKASHPDGEYHLGSITRLDAEDRTVAGILSWFSLIHTPPAELDGVLAEFRRVAAPGSRLVVGFFDSDVLETFDHKVVTAYRWPVDEFVERLRRAGFSELERRRRPAGADTRRPVAAIACAG